MPKPQKLAHVVLKSGQKDVMTKWYCKVLDAHVQFEDDVASFLTYDDEHHRIAIAQMDGAQRPSRQATGLSHIAFTYGSLEDLLTTYEELARDDITPSWTVNHGTTTSIYYNDPDKNLVELQVDNFASAEAGNEYLRSEQFASNPIGVRFAPQEYLIRWHNGESPADLAVELARVAGEPIGPPGS